MARKHNDSDFVSAAGTMLEVLVALQKLGVTDADWRAVLADKARAAEVAATLRRNLPEVAQGKSFAELVTDGRFTYVNPATHVDSNWTNKGDRVRGRFHPLRMSGTYREGDLAPALAAEGQRIGEKLMLANGYELAHYASNGWNGTDAVVAWGSSCVDRYGYRCVPYLWGLRCRPEAVPLPGRRRLERGHLRPLRLRVALGFWVSRRFQPGNPWTLRPPFSRRSPRPRGQDFVPVPRGRSLFL
jgi:hypothetical protein